MITKNITFDEVFKIWLDNEVPIVEGRDLLTFVQQEKGFSSITEWRLATALKLGLDKLSWRLEILPSPEQNLAKIIIGPFKGWSKFFDNKLTTTFDDAMQIPEFLEWCKTHDRVVPLSEKFPHPTSLIVLRKPSGELICIEGGHRACAVAYANKIGNPISFEPTDVTIAVADIDESKISELWGFLEIGTEKHTEKK